MPKPASRKKQRKILLAESDVIVRLGLAQHLRACAHVVLEASNAQEAKAILQAGQICEVLICDPQLEGAESGFGIAQWVRRHRNKTRVVLAATLHAKTLAVVELCGSTPNEAPQDAAALGDKIRLMLAERARRARPRASSAIAQARRKQVQP
ncbi:MAG: hypothetical protein QM759_04325 [Terricaulis sp.]